ncbi:unnamed protein product [Rotaria magnacalcarata]|nr:unnamed protein product [Rotaria magnacalcarata]
MECDFYKVLNKKLAERVTASNMGNPISSILNLFLSNVTNDTQNNDWPLYFVGSIFDDIFSKKHPRYQFHGKRYRGAYISQSELDSAMFANQQPDNKLAAIFSFRFNDEDFNFTIDLERISEFSDEEEVIVMPGIPFRITKVQRENPIEIELEELTINHLLGKK